MIVNIDWLKDFVDFDLSPEELADLLTNVGLESEVMLGGQTLEIDLTPNRPDCMSHKGVAREIAALTGQPLKSPEYSLTESDESIHDLISIEILDSKKCPRYACRIVKNVTIQPSPSWMAERLESVGIRSINNIVDISNYVLMELGHPLHTFDLHLIKKNLISVRAAKSGEKFITLDDIERKLNSSHLLICDGEEGIALAGIMGGKNSEISKNTKDVLIESAYFNPITIRKGSKFVGLSTESSKRFERGADYENVIPSLNRAASLLAEFAEGTVVKGIVDMYPNPIQRKEITFRPDRASVISGVEFSSDFIEKTFSGIEIVFTKRNNNYLCTPPTFRPDLEREIDLVEELARVYGYGKITSINYYHGLLDQFLQDPKYYISRLKQIFVGMGFHEVYSNSLVNEAMASQFSTVGSIVVRNPQSTEMSTMRTSLFPGLLNATVYNINRGNKDLRLFEYGITFSSDKNKDLGICEQEEFSGILSGEQRPKQWKEKSSNIDFYVLKGYMNALANSLKLEHYSFTPSSNSFFIDGQLLLTSGEEVVASYGQIPPLITRTYDIEEPVYGFNLNLGVIQNILSKPIMYQPVSPYPGSSRDLAFVVNQSVSVLEFEKIIKQKSGKLLESVTLFDKYEGEQVGKGLKSLAFNLYFQDNERTLTDEEVDEIISQIISEVSQKLNAKLR